MRALLSIEAGRGTPSVCSLDPGTTITLGRHRQNTVVLQDEHASRHHAELVFRDGHWLLRDMGTLNGTRLDGQRIQLPVTLSHGQVIEIGHTRMRFLCEPSPAEAPPAAPAIFEESDSGPLSDLSATAFRIDELTALCQFMAAAAEETNPRQLILRALQTAQRQTNATFAGYLSLDPAEAEPKLVYPETSHVDVQLSRRLMEEVQRRQETVWLGAPDAGPVGDSDSLALFQDAVCVPLRAAGTALGALHIYRCSQLFAQTAVRFLEVLAGQLASSLRLLRSRRNLQAENSRLQARSIVGDQLIGDSLVMQRLRQLIARVASRDSTVLICGESGVGKELVALTLHRQGSRQEGPFVAVNCAAIAPSLLESELFGHCKGAFTGADRNHPGLFQQADEGTLFLDEVGEMSLELQAKLLRALEQRMVRPIGARAEVPVDVRVIAATHRDLQREVAAGRFRADLFYRLNVIPIQVPPLREHTDDIPALASFFLKSLVRDRDVRLSEAAIRRLQQYAWPGNVRQLRAVLENATLTDKEIIEPEDLLLLDGTVAGEPPSLNLEELEAWAIRQALRRTHNNVSQAAKLLGICRDTLTNKMRKYGITRGDGSAS